MQVSTNLELHKMHLCYSQTLVLVIYGTAYAYGWAIFVTASERCVSLVM